MNRLRLIDDEIFYGKDILDLHRIEIKQLEEIVMEILDEQLSIDVDDDLTSPNAIFLKSLKREIDDDFIREIKELNQELSKNMENIAELEKKNSVV